MKTTAVRETLQNAQETVHFFPVRAEQHIPISSLLLQQTDYVGANRLDRDYTDIQLKKQHFDGIRASSQDRGDSSIIQQERIYSLHINQIHEQQTTERKGHRREAE